jgi:hypothetical protein
VVNGINYDRTPEGRRPLTGDDAVFLSDLEADPGERTNLRHKNPAVADELMSMLDHWQKTVNRP